MKEYLVKTDSGKYRYTGNVIDVSGGAVIEIPDGADIAFKKQYGDGLCFFQNVGENGADWCSGTGKWISRIHPVDDWYFKNSAWIREKESLNDKIATAEVARQEEKHSHYKKDVSHLNVIDPYRIAVLYNLHPCADHIMKKSLCAGNRGHKDTLRDIQDIIDTAERWKQMIEEDNNEI